MAANTNPIFTLTPRVEIGSVSTANTNRDGTGTLVTVLTAGNNGTRIDRIVMQATATTAAGMIRLFIYNGILLTTLWQEVLTSAVTPSGTVMADRHVLTSPDPNMPLLVLPSSYALKASTHNAEVWNIIPHGGDY